MIYRVNVGYSEFEFVNFIEACTFATTAKECQKEDDEVSITLIKEPIGYAEKISLMEEADNED